MNRATLALASSLILAAAAHAGVSQPTFYLHDYFFSTSPDPDAPITNTLTINTGQTVRWTWVSNFHSVLQVEGPGLSPPFHSALTDEQGFTFQHTFNTPGAFTFICEIHGSHPMPGHAMGMWGSVTVLPAPPAAAILLLTIAPRRRS